MGRDNQPAPAVSVVMNVRDGAAYVHEAIESILSQTLTDVEFVIVDDGSTDGTWEILRAFAAADDRIVLLRNHVNKGIYVSANKGIRVARAPYVARIDADDIADPRRLELQKAYLDAHEDVVLVTTNWMWESAVRGTCVPSMLPESSILSAWFLLFYNHFANQSAVMFRREPVLEIGGYNERLPVTADYELWVRLCRAHRLGVIPDALVRYRRDLPGGVTVNRAVQQRHVATLVSGRAIALATDGAVTSFPTQDFWSFWPVYWKHPYHASERAEVFHRHLVPVYRGFVDQWRGRFPAEHAEADHLVRVAVAGAFRLWAQSAASVDPRGADHLRSYAERWQPTFARA